MTISTWNPAASKKNVTAREINLDSWIVMGEEMHVESQVKQLSSKAIDELTPLMKQETTFWQEAAKEIPSEKILCLIRFFTLAEEIHHQLSAGENSPVIALNRILKSRKQPLSKEMLAWIKKNSTNRFLPNGSVL